MIDYDNLILSSIYSTEHLLRAKHYRINWNRTEKYLSGECSKAPKLESSKSPKIQSSKSPKLQISKAPKLQSSKSPKLQSFKVTKLQSSKAKNIRSSKAPKFGIFVEVQKFLWLK